MELPIKVIEQLIGKLSDPFFIVMLLIIFWLFRMLDKRDQNIMALKTGIEDVKETLSSIKENQGSILKLIEVLVYGRRDNNG